MAAPSAPAEGGLVAGRYRLGQLIGRGSSAAVYAAEDERLHRAVTVKLIDAEVARDPALRQRFQQQSAKAASLRHPHVGAVLDAGWDVDAYGVERPFVVTEPAGRCSLRDLLDEKKRLPPAQAVSLARQIASALTHAHERGLVHADVKPENVLVEQDGRNAKLVDFSLSFVSAATGVITPATLARRAAYLAPEQVRGEPVTTRTDVYGLGILLYEMLVGRPPFLGPTPETTAERRVREAPRPAGAFDPTLPRELEIIIGRAIDRNPDRRWPSVAAFEHALSALPARSLQRVDFRDLRDEEVVSPASDMSPLASGSLGRIGMLVPITALGCVVLIALWIVGPLLASGSQDAHGPYEVPDVVGLSLEQARQQAHSHGMALDVVAERESDRITRGSVIHQSPISGFQPRFTSGREHLQVTVSSGVTVPDVRGKSIPEATKTLQDLGWRVGRVDRGSHPDQKSGTITLQYPAPGQVLPEPGEILLAVAE